VTLKPKGSMQRRKTTPPGCGGFFMVIAWFLSGAIDLIDVRRAIVETENHPPVWPNGHGPGKVVFR
jgi:hypothetical protein